MSLAALFELVVINHLPSLRVFTSPCPQMRAGSGSSSRGWSRAGPRPGRPPRSGRRPSGACSRSRPGWRRAEWTWRRCAPSCSPSRSSASVVRRPNLDLSVILLCFRHALHHGLLILTPGHSCLLGSFTGCGRGLSAQEHLDRSIPGRALLKRVVSLAAQDMSV